MISNLREAVTAQLMRVEIVPPDVQPELPVMEAHKLDYNTGEDEMAFANAALAPMGQQQPAVARDPNNRTPGARSAATRIVPAAPAKKFKHCHGRYA